MEVHEVREKGGRAAALFDLDGTLMPRPSLEQRFFRTLHYRREIPRWNYYFWLREALRLLPRGFCAVTHANKMYLKGVRCLNESDTRKERDRRCPVLRFFEDGIQRVTCHAMLGHPIGVVSGTLEPLACAAARALEAELAARGFATSVHVCATRLEGFHGLWTGKILGEAMFGMAKARALRRLEQELGLDLARSWAYGDAAADRWMLEAVGHPVAVNPARRLARIAQAHAWPVLRWKEEKEVRRATRGRQEGRKRQQEGQPTLQQPEPCA